MGNAHRGDDDIAFYAASLKHTTLVAVTDVAAQTTDADGALPPGRYLLHIADVTGTIWIAMGKYEPAGSVEVAASVPHFPMSAATIIAIEVNIIKGDNDRVAAIASAAGSANLYVTLISRGA